MPRATRFVHVYQDNAGQSMAAAQAQIEEEQRRRAAGAAVMPDETFAELADTINATNARNAIMAKWLALAGPASDVGLPLDTKFPIRKEGGAFVVDFRGGGTMKVLDTTTNNVIIDPSPHITVTFEGLGLEMRQEQGGDKLYGIVSVAIGSLNSLTHGVIPMTTLGPKANNRIYQTSAPIFEGRPNDLSMAIKLWEHDSGDEAGLRAEFRNRVQQVFQTGIAAVGGAAGGATGTALNAIGSDSSVNTSLVGWAIRGLADGLLDILGVADDEYNGTIVSIPYGDMINIPPTKVYHCSSDPKTIQYTHSVTLTGVDGGGDRGQVTLLFKVRQT